MAIALVTPGTTSTGTPSSPEEIEFLPTPAEEKRITAFEPYNPPSGQGPVEHQGLDLVLLKGMVAPVLPAVYQLGKSRECRENLVPG